MSAEHIRPGVIYVRKRAGHKLVFLIGGPCLADAYRFLTWGNDTLVYEFKAPDVYCSIVPPTRKPP